MKNLLLLIFNKYVAIFLASAVMMGCEVPVRSVTVMTEVPVEQHALYQASLPDFLDMPQTPTLVVIGEEATGYSANAGDYRELVVGILSSYQGVERWWVLTQPLNDIDGYNSGIELGYPKYLTDMCITDTGSTFDFEVNCNVAPLDFAINHTNDPSVVVNKNFRDAFATGQFSVGQDGCLKQSVGTFDLDPAAERRKGIVYLTNNYTAPWAALFPEDHAFPGEVYVGKVFNLDNQITDIVCGPENF